MDNDNYTSDSRQPSDFPPPIPPPIPPQQNYYVPVQQPPKKSFFKKILITFLILFFIGGMLLAAGAALLISSTFVTGMDKLSTNFTDEYVNYTFISDGTDSEIIAVVDIAGIITSSQNNAYGANSKKITTALEAAASDPFVKCIIINMNTPGGEVIASDVIYNTIKEIKSKYGIKVITYMNNMAASGGYYIAAASDHIMANRLTLTGSIGVIMSSVNLSGMLDKIGVAPQTYRSGDMKDIMSMSRPSTEKEKIYLQSLIQETFDEFAKIVAEGRPAFETAEDVKKSVFADGRILTGAKAKELGLVDSLGYFNDAVSEAKKMIGVSDPKVIRYSTKNTLIDLLLSSKVNTSLTSSLLPVKFEAIEAGRMYFLAPESVSWQ